MAVKAVEAVCRSGATLPARPRRRGRRRRLGAFGPLAHLALLLWAALIVGPIPGNRVIYCLFVSGMTFPVLLALVPLFFVVRDLGLLDTHLGVIVVYTAYSLPFTLSMAIIPIMIVYIVFQRQIQSGLTSGAVK